MIAPSSSHWDTHSHKTTKAAIETCRLCLVQPKLDALFKISETAARALTIHPMACYSNKTVTHECNRMQKKTGNAALHTTLEAKIEMTLQNLDLTEQLLPFPVLMGLR